MLIGEAFFDPSDSYFLFADLVGFYTHLTYTVEFVYNEVQGTLALSSL
jgi:hypothetical protein